MAIASLQIPQSNVNNLVDQSTWGTLANLGNVYQAAQDKAVKKSILAQLGDDPQVNQHLLLTSTDPALAQLGLSLQEKGVEQQRQDARYKVTDKRADAELAIQQAAARRAQEAADQAEADRKAAGDVYARFGTPPGAAPAFPAPLPSPQAAVPPQATAPAVPPFVPPQPTAPELPRMPGVNGVVGNAVPEAAVPPQAAVAPSPQPAPAIPVKAADEDTGLPSWASPQSLVGKVATSLVTGRPAAAAGVSNDDLRAMGQNPLTRPLAQAFVQAKLNPGTYSFQNVAGVGLVRTNDKNGIADVVVRDTKPIEHEPDKQLLVPDGAGGFKDVTPGGAPVSKEQRQRDERYADAIARNIPEDAARSYALTGKMPNEDLRPDERTEINKKSDAISNGLSVIENIQTLKRLSPNTYSGYGALGRAQLLNMLPSGMQTQSSLDTQELTNVAHQNVSQIAKTVFGSRITNLDLQMLKELEGSADQPDAVRQKIYTRVEKRMTQLVNEQKAEVEGIRNKTYYKPQGGGATAAPAPTRPPLSDIFGTP